MSLSRCIAVLSLIFFPWSAAHAQKNFGFDNRKPSGQPYLSPEESVQRLKVPPGWEVKLVAGEPDVINPIAFTIDERGRLWVVECFEYPKRTPKGQKPRDRIKIIEEVPGGKPKVTLWAEGKTLPIGWDLASGIEVGHGGVFLGAPPYLFFIKDDNGKAGKQEILLRGFGSQDTHETLNTFQWGPDSKLYGLHGVFTVSEVKPGEPGASATGVKMNAAVWRYDVRGKKFDIFAEGTSNPWGMDFDSRGNCFLACCVIPHLFHMVPGGTYKRQAGSSFNPYAFGLLNEICDHQHHKESGWAHAGLLCLDDGDHVPEPYRGSLLMGSIHGCCIKRDTLRPNGSTFIGSCAPDFLSSGDKNFRPINLRWGPDGSIYVIDWHDQNPCHQTPPDAWDYSRGRIYKIQRKFSGEPKATAVDLSTKTSKELLGYLKEDNPYWYRTALRLLSERRDRSVIEELARQATGNKDDIMALRALWGLYAVGGFGEIAARDLLGHKSAERRSWAIRLAGEPGTVSEGVWKRLVELAFGEKSPKVRLQLASTAQRLTKHDVLPLLHRLMKHKEDAKDPVIPLMIWLAYEPRIVSQREPALDWLKDNAAGNPLLTNEIVPRTMRRLAATGKADDLTACVKFLGDVSDSAVRRQALDGLIQAYKNRTVDPPADWKRVFAALLKDKDSKVHELARRLAVNFQDKEALARALALVQDPSKGSPQRIDAIRDVALVHPPEAAKVFLNLLTRDQDLDIRREVCRGLANYDNAEIPKAVLSGWKGYPPAVRGEAVNLLAGRKTWAKELLAAVGSKQVPRTDLTDNTILRIRAFKDDGLNKQIEAVWGRFRDTPADLEKLIAKMRGHLHDGKASFARGKIVFDNQCAKCHKFDGRGHEVGPNLDGAARDIEYLLANILDPNRVIGQPYFIHTVELKNGRIETGILHAEDDQSITLKTENDVLKIIPKKDIEGKVLVQEKSMMPEGLAGNMSVQDFRDLVRYAMAHPFITDVEVLGPFPQKEQTIVLPTATVGPAGRIPLPAVKGEPMRALVRAEVTAPAAVQTKLLLGARHPVQVRLNDKMVYQGRPGSEDAQPDQAVIDVTLQAGVNRLLFEVSYQGDNEVLYARLLDPDRRLRYAEGK